MLSAVLMLWSGQALATSVYGLATTFGYEGTAAFASCSTATVPCSGTLSGYAVASSNTAESLAFATLLADMGGAGHMRWARFAIPYDALNIEGPAGTGCVQSPAYSNPDLAGPGDVRLTGQQVFDALVWAIQAAAADGLTPEVAFTNGSGDGAPPIPDPGYGSGAKPFVGITQAGDDYRCGVTQIMRQLAPGNSGKLPVVVNWEAWNEPNGSSVLNGALGGECASASPTNPCGGGPYGGPASLCNSSGSSPAPAQCGPIEASELWELANVAATQLQQATGTAETVAALTANLSGTPAANELWNGAYAVGIHGSAAGTPGFMPGDGLPSVWAVHDYADVLSWPSTPVISSFTSWLRSNFGTGLQVWITEAAANLRPPGCKAPCSPTTADGSPATQASDAENFLKLAGYGNGEAITDVDWFEFQPANESTGWDSGLLSAGQGRDLSPDGLYSQERQSYCVLTGATGCSTSSGTASDWSASWDVQNAPTGVAAGPVTATSVQVDWRAAPGAPAGTTYELFDSGSSLPAISDAGGGPQELGGLPPNSAVGFSVVAVSNGVASPAATGSAVTLAATPSAPAVTGETATAVGLSWTEPSGGNAPASYEIVDCRGTEAVCRSGPYATAATGVDPACARSCSYRIAGLSPGTAYSFGVASVNSQGDASPVSGTASTTTYLPPSFFNQAWIGIEDAINGW